MKQQLLMCVKTVLGASNEVLAAERKVYTYRDSTACAMCARKVVSVQEVQHPYKSGCIPGDDWLPSNHFVPLNDPDAKPENEDVDVPFTKELLETAR